eukprot:gene11119-18742_t
MDDAMIALVGQSCDGDGNASRRSAQAFPITLAPGAKFSDAKESFSEMLGVPSEQLIRLTTVDGHIVLPGQPVPEEPLVLEVDKRAFDRLTGSGSGSYVGGSKISFSLISNITGSGSGGYVGGSKISFSLISNIVIPLIIVSLLFAGWAIILGGLASASNQCSDDVAAWMFSNLFAWGSQSLSVQISGINLEWTCGLSLSLFWTIIMIEFVMVIIPAIVLLLKASSFSADTKGSWAYIITCTLNIVTAVLCLLAFTVVPGAYYAQAIDQVLVPSSLLGLPINASNDPTFQLYTTPANYVRAVEVMAAGVIILLFANFAWIYAQACGKMIPEEFVMCAPKSKAPAGDAMSPAMTPTKSPTVMSV